MELNRRELEVLELVLTKKENLTNIASALKIKKSNLSRYVKKLENCWLITEWQKGRTKIIKAESPVEFGFSQIKGEFPALKLTDILIGKTPFFLSFLKRKEQFRIADLDLPVASAKRVLTKLRNLGILNMPKRGSYGVRKEAGDIIDFTRNTLLRAYAMEGKLKFDASPMRIMGSFNSCKDIEVVIEVNRGKKAHGYWPTAYSVFHGYGVKLIMAGKFYYTNFEPELEDILIHALVISNDTRSIAYVAALMTKNKIDYKKLLGKKQKFGISEEFLKNLIEFVKTKGKKTFERFPSWEEVEGVLNG
ncbi:MAG: hypothetical protein WCT31_04570 [Candidatus Micrarchaeia archaeon]|jgi:hypothetical protein